MLVGLVSYSAITSIREKVTSQETIVRAVTNPGYSTLSLSEGVACFYFVAVCAFLMLLARTGPIGVNGPAGFWWLNLPLRRSAMLAKPAVRSLFIVVVLFEAMYLPVILLSPKTLTAETLLLTITCTALLAVAIAMLALLAQVTARKDLLDRICIGAILAASIVIYLIAVLNSKGGVIHLQTMFLAAPSNWPILVLGGARWPVYVSVAVVALASPLLFMFDRIRRAELLSSGSRAAHLGASLYIFDIRQLSYAFASSSVTRRGLEVARISGVRRSFVAAHLQYFLRLRGKTSTIVMLAVIPSVLPIVSGINNPLVVGGAFAMSAAAVALLASYPMQIMTEVPGLGRQMPFSVATLRRLAGCAAGVILFLWASLVCTIVLTLGVVTYAIPMLLLAIPGLIGCSLTAAHSPNDDQQGITLGMLGAAILAIVCMVPLVLTIIVGVISPILLLLQVAATAGALWWGLRVPPRRLSPMDIDSFEKA
ncbi:DUF6297 family protein (plasmid) [Arthrobacter sp. zg-Y820]|nr:MULTISPECIES: DUF6297 family protein [unclassified Arthrobacter]MDK1281401.1 DUF6297 family protein [Arthrobacter sp. zg.Y820]WIB11271.1 DUF6297 family protein [Arthrobacter sp. zg-Y820]